MNKCIHICFLLLMLAVFLSCKRKNRTDLQRNNIEPKPKEVTILQGAKGITRMIKQDRKGNIWIAAFDGIFRYDGKSLTNITSKVSSARFFSVLEDRKDNLWFGSIGSGVYCYNGKSFRNFTTREGLANNEVTSIYEDKTGNVWFGTSGGISRYDGKSFRTFTMKEGLPSNGVNSIIQDKTGKFWFGTRGYACVYDGKTFTILTHNGTPFKNVRTIIEDKKGNIWLGGKDGLWCYDGKTFINFTPNFVGYIYEDKNGNIWTSSESANNQGWVLSRYDEKPLYKSIILHNTVHKPIITQVMRSKGLIFGILEANDGKIWFATMNGVYLYDGNSITDFKGNPIYQAKSEVL